MDKYIVVCQNVKYDIVGVEGDRNKLHESAML